jgi:hypothetical protein
VRGNLDVEFSSHNEHMGFDLCLPDDQEGEFLVAKTIWQCQSLRVNEGEATGLWYATKWTFEL